MEDTLPAVEPRAVVEELGSNRVSSKSSIKNSIVSDRKDGSIRSTNGVGRDSIVDDNHNGTRRVSFAADVEVRETEPANVDAGMGVNEDSEVPEEVEEDVKVAARTDRYGFILPDQSDTSHELTPEQRRQHAMKENSRLQKWLAMMGTDPESWFKFRKKDPRKVKERCRKGIPEAVRGRAWVLLMESNVLQHRKCTEAGEDVYAALLKTTDIPDKDTIDRDIGRTFPKHQMFKKGNDLGQGSLRRVLYAYSSYDPDVGYCQGMGFITAMFLSYMPEEDAFWLLVAAIQHQPTNLQQLYVPGMPLMQRCLFVWDKLFQKVLPRLHAHFMRENVHGSMYATQWYITLFTNTFRFELVTRVWDAFLCEGWKVVHRVGLALLKNKQAELLRMDFESILMCMRELPATVNTQQTMDTAEKISITSRQIRGFEGRFEQEELQRRHSGNGIVLGTG